ncbi:MAG: hypothetical protein VX730_01105 [Pseudomonadota bacterium]|nr:hypothetical protein [Pseudomonadota bacterium]
MRRYAPAFGVLAGLLVSACTPEIEHFAKSEWQDVKTFEYGKTFSKISGFSDAFPSYTERSAALDQRLCLHQESERRTITVNGVNDQQYYRRCTLMPYPTPQLHRF